MRIVVCVKHVPDLQSTRAFDARGRTVRTAADGTLNEVDENAIEEALQIVSALESGEVIALTLGPEPAVDAVRRALQMGADRAVHLCDEAFAGSDYAATARALAAGIRVLDAEQAVDLVLTGMTALDGLGSVVPAMLAAELGRAHLGVVQRLEIAAGQVHAVRELSSVTEELTAQLPVVVSVTDLINSPRLPKFKDIMAARDKPVTVWTAADVGLEPEMVGAAGSLTRPVRTEPRPPRDEPEIITDDDGEAGRRLAEYLIAHDLIRTETP